LNFLKKWGRYILYGLAVIGTAIIASFFRGGDNKEILEKFKEGMEKESDVEDKEDKIEESVDEREKDAEELADEMEQTNEEMEETEKDFQDYFHIFIIILLSISMIFLMSGNLLANEPPELGEMKQPTTFEEALELANKMKDFALQWRAFAYEQQGYAEEWKMKYEAEHADLKNLQKVCDEKDEIIDFYKELANDLMKQQNNWNASIGVNVSPLNPINTGLILMLGKQF